jgi:hypothetical protein
LLDVENDGTFELRLRAPQSVYLDGGVVDLLAMYAYIGTQPRIDVGSFAPLVGFEFWQLDGSPGKASTRVFDGACRVVALEGGVLSDAGLTKVSVRKSQPAADAWMNAFLDDPVLRLPAGTWRVTAVLSTLVGSCSGEPHAVQASIDITVVPTG